MRRTARIMGTLLHSEVAIRLTQNARLTEAVSRAMGMSIELRHMIDTQIDAALARREASRADLLNQIKALEARVAALEAERQSSKASS